MNLLRLLPVILSFLLLAAHFSRANVNILALFSLLFLVLLFIKRPWVPLVLKIVMAIGVAEWLRAMVVYVLQRQEAGEPWMRLVFILGGVALFTALSMIAFRNNKLKKYFRQK